MMTGMIADADELRSNQFRRNAALAASARHAAPSTRQRVDRTFTDSTPSRGGFLNVHRDEVLDGSPVQVDGAREVAVKAMSCLNAR